MHKLIEAPPYSPVKAVTEILHGISVTDPYRWLEDQHSPRTRKWIAEQSAYTSAYLESIPRKRIRRRIRQFLAIQTYESPLQVGNRYFFRKRLPDQEQPCICMREGVSGEDQLLVDPAQWGTGNLTAVNPLCASPEGHLLLYEVKEGGELTSTFTILDIATRKALRDVLPRGCLRGFAFAPDGRSFYYVHEGLGAKRPFYRAAYHHVLGTEFGEDREIFSAGEDKQLRLSLISDAKRLGFLVYRFHEKTQTDLYLKRFECEGEPQVICANVDNTFCPLLLRDRVLVLTDRDAPNLRLAEIRVSKDSEPVLVDVVPECEARITGCVVAGEHIFISYLRRTTTQVLIFDLWGKKTGEVPIREDETVRLVGGSPDSEDLMFESESFTAPIAVSRYSPRTGKRSFWARRDIPFEFANFSHSQVWYTSKDGTRVPMFLVGRRDVLAGGDHATIMTSYGGSGVSMTPQFSVLVAFLIEHGCLFALPNIRGGSEFGAAWHSAAKGRNRQNAYDDFLCAAEWLIATGRTTPQKLAIFGGSNAGLLVGVALTQRPDLFRAAVCMVPILDMLRYHLFDDARAWQPEFGTAEDPDDFATLIKYSPYHRVRQGVAYPATMIVSGDADGKCNPLHARKMTARLQAANTSERPILLDYSQFRGHAPVLPLSVRIESLTDRLAFLCDQLQLRIHR
ncbi:MAG: prolyl oligopeptidase family serine peptidase [Terriglobales bacterium]